MNNHVISASVRLLAVCAHPDGETYRAGVPPALLAHRGILVQVLTTTRGQAGSWVGPALGFLKELAAVCESAFFCAWAALESQILFLGSEQFILAPDRKPEDFFSDLAMS
jgi:LmbE family N-acetylglucosaminyl deacetylase